MSTKNDYQGYAMQQIQGTPVKPENFPKWIDGSPDFSHVSIPFVTEVIQPTKLIKNAYEAQQAIHDALCELQVAQNCITDFDVCSMERLESVIAYLEVVERQQARYAFVRLLMILTFIVLLVAFGVLLRIVLY